MSNKKIIAIGNAITDLVCKTDDQFLADHSLIKGSMSLIDEATSQKLAELAQIKVTSGGSAANTATAFTGLGGNAAFIGKVALDDFGRKFIEEINKASVEFCCKNFAENASANSFILVTDDAQRTMCTFLGCASQITENDIDENDIKSADIMYLEGYLWDQPSTINALKKAITLAKKNDVKIAFTLSDSFCVARHKKDFIHLIENDLDILFANEDEIKELLHIKDIEKDDFAKIHQFFAQNDKLIAAVTRSNKGCVIFDKDRHYLEEASQIDKLVDTTGAGDCFAAGFLFGLVDGYDLRKSAWLGNQVAGKIIQKFGARFDEGEL